MNYPAPPVASIPNMSYGSYPTSPSPIPPAPMAFAGAAPMGGASVPFAAPMGNASITGGMSAMGAPAPSYTPVQNSVPRPM
eukprot:NODE_5254_length_591_cov_17.566421_g4548_i0.p2 GENE.NODE_5254_length_591_cov_17.566421_g4548_i0~~NODE_5254_length_591_cov_17.566421_g4548_i0.p2  ORF type:complete len:81 (-),score=12.42 NODE_5254_length_591_cov_17.566421_g4548_i0:123-365(-)